MADKYFGKGTVSPVASGNMTPLNPASLAVDDILICCIVQHDNVVATMPAGWTRIVATNSTTATRLDSFWRRVTSTGESSASVTVTRAAGDAGIAQIVAFRGITNSGNPHNTSLGQANASSATVTMPSITPSAAGQTIVFIGAMGDDGAFAAVSGTDPAPTEREDSLTALGLDASLLIATGERSVSTATGARTSVNVRTLANAGAQIALTNAAAGPTTIEADANSTGTGTALGTSGATATSPVTAAGTVGGQVNAAALFPSVAAATATATPLALTATVLPSVGAATGTSTPLATTAARFAAIAATTATATATGIATALTLSTAAATGAGAATGITAGITASTASSTGTSTVLADAEDGQSAATIIEATAAATGSASGAAIAAGVATGVAASTSSAGGSITASALLAAIASANGAASAAAAAENAAGSSIIEATASASGLGTATGLSAYIIGTVASCVLGEGSGGFPLILND